jgi:hypothetical protein
MSEKLFEQNFMTFDLRTIGRLKPEAAPVEPETAAEEPDDTQQLGSLPAAGEWEAWGALLDERKNANNKLASNVKKTEYEVESEFFKEFYSINWPATAKILMTFGEPLKKVIRVLKFQANNPVISFISKNYVIQELLIEKKLTANTFTAIYNALAKKLVPVSEFIRDYKGDDEYNLIYCPKLYDKSVKEIEEYLTLQSQILDKSKQDTYVINRQAFLKVKELANKYPDAADYAKAVNSNTNIPQIATSELNSIDLARQISGKVKAKNGLGTKEEQSKLISALGNNKTAMYATLCYLQVNAGSKKAEAAINSHAFSGVNKEAAMQELLTLSKNKVVPNGYIDSKMADEMVDQILAKLTNDSEKSN